MGCAAPEPIRMRRPGGIKRTASGAETILLANCVCQSEAWIELCSMVISSLYLAADVPTPSTRYPCSSAQDLNCLTAPRKRCVPRLRDRGLLAHCTSGSAMGRRPWCWWATGHAGLPQGALATELSLCGRPRCSVGHRCERIERVDGAEDADDLASVSDNRGAQLALGHGARHPRHRRCGIDLQHVLRHRFFHLHLERVPVPPRFDQV